MLQFAEALFGLYATEEAEGQGLVEYALIIAFIAVVVIVAMVFLQGKISTLFSKVANSLNKTRTTGFAVDARRGQRRCAPLSPSPIARTHQSSGHSSEGQHNRRRAMAQFLAAWLALYAGRQAADATAEQPGQGLVE